MADDIAPKALAQAVGITRVYAWQLLRADPPRQPSMTLALRIMRATGLKLGPLKDASPDEIAALSRFDARQTSQADAA